ncbi:MAG: YutD family protein [Lactococcus plantarum]|nr:YutD family protein [Lactococcus plantarum]MDN6069889.1 YutD family protein [Lactococcus plantarum]MDN6083928.1 YutD family protein [Lactococcus plantarum]
MAKVVPEEEKNYNKFPGERVIVVDDVVTIGDKVYHLVHNYQDGFDKDKLAQRYSDIFVKYDYIVGDWGHEQLRLKGFFSSSRKKIADELKISHLEEYIKEYMNYGAAFFVLKRMRSKDIKRNEPFLSEKVYEVDTPEISTTLLTSKKDKNKKTAATQKQTKPVKRQGTQKQRQSTKGTFDQKEKSSAKRPSFDKQEDKQVSKQKTTTKRPAFVVRTRNK